MKLVLDSSAVLALLKPEPTRVDLDAHVPGQPIAAVNYSEVADYFARLGSSKYDIVELLSRLDLHIIPMDADLALEVAMMRPVTQETGLSLGDRCCLALAKKMGVPALTGDRRWVEVADKVGVELILLR